MSKSSVNNKRIAKNTLYLYIRMLFIMAVSLYTVRAILDILGVVDYGIYNVVGGVVTMFAFMNKTLSTSSQRYFSVALAKKDDSELKRVFSLNLTVFSLIGLIIVVFLETVGLWFVNSKMTIPAERMDAANVVYQLSILSMALHIVVIPYMALVVAHEKMNIFAIIGVVDGLLKLAIVFLLTVIPFDKLIIYGILVLLLSFINTVWYAVYCRRHYPESHFRWYWNKGEAFELLGFSGWHFLGTFSSTCRSQGINILLNLFFNPAVNAARGVAYQVYAAVHQLVSNFFTAVKPQIYKSYASGQYEDLYKLIDRSTLMCSFLISLLVFPILANTDFVLELWLKKVPEYVIVFTQLILINGLVDSIEGPTIASALATGKIKKYMLVLSGVMISNIPISYVALLMGCEPWITMCISIFLSCVAVFVRGYMLGGLIGFPFKDYMILISRIGLVYVILGFVCRFVVYGMAQNFIQFAVSSFLIMVLVTALFALALSKSDRKLAVGFVRKKISATFHRN